MKSTRIISLWLVLLLIAAGGDARAQLCPPNMLSLPEDGGHAVFQDHPSVRLSGAFTIEFWAKPISAADRTTFIEKGNGGELINYSIALGQLNTVQARVLTPTGVVTLTSDAVLNITAWHHYAMVYKPGDSLYLYVDGERMGAARVQSQSLVVGSDALRIGTSILPGSRTLYGSMDELRIWKVARTQAQIVASKGGVIDTGSAGLSAYFTFDDAASKTGFFFESKRRVARLSGSAQLVTSTAPVTGRSVPYKLQAKEKIVILPVKSCITQFDTVVRVRNLWFDSINVNQMGMRRGTAFSVAGPAKLVLPPDSSFYGEIRIQFNPTASGIYVDTIVISSNSACAGEILIPIIDTFVASGFRIVERSVVIPTTLNCALPTTRKITLRNIGSTELAITKAAWSSEINAVVTPIPLSIPAGQTREVTIRFDQGPEGTLTSDLSFESDVCSRSASIPVSITRESITYVANSNLDLGEKIILSSEIVIDTAVWFTNTSSRSILISGANIIGSTNFTIEPPVFTLSVAPDETVRIPIRFKAVTCGNYASTLRLFGNPCAIELSIPLRVVVTGPKPDIAGVIDVGFNCSQKDTTLALFNPYDSAITLTGFSFSAQNVFRMNSSFPITIQPLQSASLSLTFLPTVEREYEVNLTMANAKCGAVVVKLRGSYGTRSIAVTPAVDFGRGCELEPVRRSVTLTNNSPREVVVAGAATFLSPRFRFIDADLPLLVVPGESKEFVIEFTPENSAVTKGIAQFTIAGGCKTSQADLYGSREEPVLTINESLLDFDTVCPTFTQFRDVLVTNNGIDSVDAIYSFTSGSGAFTLVDVKPSLKRGVNVLRLRFAPQTTDNYVDTLVIASASCETVHRIALTGSGGSNPTLSYSNDNVSFGEVEISNSSERCIEITNTSCTPITLEVASFALSDPKFRLKQTSLDALPLVLANGEQFELCMTYHPAGRAQDATTLIVSPAGVAFKAIALSGRGIAPDLSVSDSLVDFGFVPIGDDRSRRLEIYNRGEVAATVSLTFDAGNSAFGASVASISVPADDTVLVDLSFSPTLPQLYENTLELEGGASGSLSIDLRGFGIQRGLVVDRTGIEFGDVRVNEEKRDTFTITANVFPTTLTEVRLTDGGNAEHYLVELDQKLPFVFSGAADTVTATVTFKPLREQQLDHMVALRSSVSQFIELPLRGRGVDAHISTPEVIDFGPALFETTTFLDYTIENTGLYPLTISGSTTEWPFQTASSSIIIPPGESEVLSVGFTPELMDEVSGELLIRSDAAEGDRIIVLKGRGGDVAPGKGHVRYTLPDVSAEIGDLVTIPIMISHGQLLDQFAADSFYVEFKYDPWMLYIHGVEDLDAVTNGMNIQSKKTSDSTFAVWGNGATLDLEVGKTLVALKGEALFGPREITAMQIIEAYPRSIATLADPRAVFTVTNCHDQTAAAVHKGAYAVQHVVPTPTRSTARIDYTLGFNGSSEIEIMDALGRLVKRVTLPERPKGEHSFTLDVSDLPNGNYFGIFRSREFIKRIDLVIEH